MINADDFLDDYNRMFEEISKAGQTGIWTAEPFVGISWMEAVMGNKVKIVMAGLAPLYSVKTSIIERVSKNIKASGRQSIQTMLLLLSL